MIDPAAKRELTELRDAINNTRVVLKGLQRQARAAVKLACDLEERLEAYDTRLYHAQREAQEAQHAQHQARDPVSV